MKKLLIVAAIAAALAVLHYYGLHDYLSVDALKARKAEFDGLYRANPLLVAGGFFFIYVVVTAISFPGAAIMTLAAGALFGLVIGAALVSFASTIGATLAFLASRHLFRDAVMSRFGDRLAAFSAGFERDGAFYLFSLRLIPVVPFFVINLLMGLTSIRTRTYYWVSQIGMILGTIVYVNAGTQLARVNTLKDVASPVLLASFAALGLFPWVARRIVGRLRRSPAT
jgi:uncharacterized membrane protein YdjX (TVP38/TMEM64 family)